MKKHYTLLFTLLALSPFSKAQTNLVVNGNFSQAHACPESNFTSDYSCDPTAPINGPGNLAVASNATVWNNPWYGTSRTTDGTNFLIADGGATPNNRVWIQSVNVTNGQQYTFSAYVKNIVNPGSGAGIDQAFPTVSLRVNTTVIATSDPLAQTAVNNWTLVSGTYTATSTGSITLNVFQNMVNNSYNDIGIDDINFASTTPTAIFDGTSNANWNVVVAPNPFAQETSIFVKTTDPSEIRAEVYTTNGLLVSANYFQSSETFSLGKELNAGMYFVKLYQNDASQTVKILKQ